MLIILCRQDLEVSIRIVENKSGFVHYLSTIGILVVALSKTAGKKLADKTGVPKSRGEAVFKVAGLRSQVAALALMAGSWST
ncbi:MAG: hypothetical protein WCY84_03315 [Candidatus Cloacimonadaceae bacterium]